jgi:hypothetical protein
MRYNQVIEDLKKSLNTKGNNALFKDSVRNLKNLFGVGISTKYLKGLIEGNDGRKKTHRVSYLLRSVGFKTKKGYKDIKVSLAYPIKRNVQYFGYSKKGEVEIRKEKEISVLRERNEYKREVLFFIVTE